MVGIIHYRHIYNFNEEPRKQASELGRVLLSKIWFSSQNQIYKISVAILAVFGQHHKESTNKQVILVVGW